MSPLPDKPPPSALARRDEEAETLHCVLGSITRRDRWEPPEAMRTLAVLGSVVLDYRDADLPLGVTDVDCLVFMGSVQLIVPPDVDVEVTGSVFLGSVETRGRKQRTPWLRRVRDGLVGPEPAPEDDEERPLLRVDCSGMMGSVEVRVR